MIKILRRSLAITIAWALVQPLPGWSHLGDIVYPIFELPTADLPDLHDGSLEDWETALPNASLTHNDLVQSGPGAGEPPDPGNLAFRMFMAWNFRSQQIYMATEQLDDIYLAPGTGHVGNGYIRILVDGDHSGGQFWFFPTNGYPDEEFRRESNRQAQSYTVEQSLEGTPFDTFDWQEWSLRPPYADIETTEYGESPHYTLVELAFTPWDDLNWADPDGSRRSSLRPNAIIGFNIQVADLDEPDLLSARYTLVEPATIVDTHYGTADNFVDAELIPCQIGDCSHSSTAVQPSSWARIKAGLLR